MVRGRVDEHVKEVEEEEHEEEDPEGHLVDTVAELIDVVIDFAGNGHFATASELFLRMQKFLSNLVGGSQGC